MLYRLAPPGGQVLLPLNPLTLADLSHGRRIRLGAVPAALSAGQPWTLPSADGATLAAVYYLGGNASADTAASDILIRVIDRRTGALHAQVHPQVPIQAQGLSPDGAQLFGPGLAPVGRGRSRHGVWYALATATGRVVHQVDFPSPDAWDTRYDAAGRRLYLLDMRPFDGRTHRPRTPLLRAYDVVSGHQVGVLALDGVLAGTGRTARQVGGQPIYAAWQPGFALSPDGRHLAVLDGNTDLLRLIDARSLTIVQTEGVTRPRGALERLGAWLGVLPAVAFAKGGEGVVLDLHFAPDGHRLYALGTKGEIAQDGRLSMRRLGLRVIDVARGQIMAEAPQGWLGMPSDGQALYTLTGDDTGSRWTLRRADPLTLQVLAQRTFDVYPQVSILDGSIP
jgi:hypothetical protein